MNTTTQHCRRELLTSPALQPAVICTKGQTLQAVLTPFVSSKGSIELTFQPAHSDNWICNELSVTYGGRDFQSMISHKPRKASEILETALRACSNNHLHHDSLLDTAPHPCSHTQRTQLPLWGFEFSAKVANLPGFWGQNLRATQKVEAYSCASTLIPSE